MKRPGATRIGCPKHGGKDGFRFFRNAALTGGGICNSCTNPRTGKLGFPDGFDLLMWVNDWTFRETLEEVAAVLGMLPGHQHRQPVEPLPEALTGRGKSSGSLSTASATFSAAC
ncbi:MAG TPA: primase-helicase zinc-binding domain-containing protein [Azospirillaceae bacterium]|nr:primase-helicase zinc-binding domain-containing protein [Azospirillaceae bacterium]